MAGRPILQSNIFWLQQNKTASQLLQNAFRQPSATFTAGGATIQPPHDAEMLTTNRRFAEKLIGQATSFEL